jgi:Fungal specific transcription factor domain
MRVNDETVIQFESFLPSPRVSSSSEISDPELVTGVSDAMEVEFPLDPSLSNGIHMLVGDVENAPHEFIPTYPMEQRYDSYPQQHDLEHYNPYQGLPIDPNLTTNAPKNDGFPIIQDDTFPRAENVNIFALFPDLTLDQQGLTQYIDGSFDDKATLDLLKDTSRDDILPSNMPPPESRRRGRPSRNFKAQNNPRFRKSFTEECRSALLEDLQNTFACQVQETQIPLLPAIQRFINRFFQSFNNRLPILHLPSFDISVTPAPLILAICSIGALFSSEKDVANDLRELAKQAQQSIDSTSERSIWEVQCKLLLIVQASFGGDCTAVNWALENLGFFHREFTSRRVTISTTRDTKLTSWTTWVERESSKRLLFGMFIISSLLTLTYNISPCLSTTEDLKIEMPAEESAWMAADENSWKKAMTTAVPPSVDVYHALTRVLFGKDFNPDSEIQWPAFAVTILMHAVHVHMWHVTQSTQSFINFSSNVKIEEQMKSLCTSQTEEALERCYMIFAHRRPCDEEKNWDDVEGPLLFNGMAVLRSCYVRAFTGSGSFNRSMLFSDDEEATFRVAKDYMQIEQVRTPFLSAAVAQAFDGLLTPLLAVHKHSEKEAILAWSVEHVIAAWDSGK